jgi:tetratricopeptide (TPR) repeat protein
MGSKAGWGFIPLTWISVASLLWLLSGGPAWLPIPIILVYLGLCASAGRLPFRRTVFDFALLLFGLTACVGVWAAYDRALAWEKLGVLALALLIYYALAVQPAQNGRWLAGLICSWGVILSLHFLLVYDWQALPADFRLIARLGQAWMAVRPTLPGQALTPNITAGLLAAIFPFTLALGLPAWRERRTMKNAWPLIAGAGFTAGLLLLTLFMTSSRGAWLAFTAGLIFWLAWHLGERSLAGFSGRRKLFVVLSAGAVLVLAFGLVFVRSGSLTHLFELVPGLPTGQSRLGIDRLALHLITDFPFTGGGLGAFAGLFSQYMLVIPHVLFTYSHNLYLDVALEQGLLGLFLLGAIFLGSALLLFRAPASEDEPFQRKLLRQAALVSLVVLCLHGLVDDPFYSGQGTPLLWFIPGLAIFSHPEASTLVDILPERLRVLGSRGRFSAGWGLAGALFLITAAVILVLGPKRLAAMWMADQGAVRMARVQLNDFPSHQWDDALELPRLAPAQAWLERAVSLDPENRTANQRLGLIALQRQDFRKAIGYLEAAHRQDPSHYGVIKNLGYAYAWAGQYDLAQQLLAQIPEAKQELGNYRLWWQTQGRDDLSHKASEMRARLMGGSFQKASGDCALFARNTLFSL